MMVSECMFKCSNHLKAHDGLLRSGSMKRSKKQFESQMRDLRQTRGFFSGSVKRGARSMWQFAESLLTTVIVAGVTLSAAAAQQPAIVGSPVAPGFNRPILDLRLVDIPGGLFVMGDPNTIASMPPQWVRVERFVMMESEVTNRMFSAFVESTGYRTDSERTGAGYVYAGAWTFINGAAWLRPRGPGTSIFGLEEHPVVQVSQRDAAAFCAWARLRLPTEVEWEYAGRGNQDIRPFPWGEGIDHRFGNFGDAATALPSGFDGYIYTAPVGTYPAGQSLFGLFDMAGNVWEWTATRDTVVQGHVIMRGGGWGNDFRAQQVTAATNAAINIGMDMVGFRCAGSLVAGSISSTIR